jgi:chemotaxis protein MotA
MVMGSVVGGYIMAHGKIATLLQIPEFVIIVGAAVGSMIVGNPAAVLRGIVKSVLGLLKPPPHGKRAFIELLRLLHEILTHARRNGLLSLESHAENPRESDIFKRYPSFSTNHDALEFLADCLRVIVTGIEPFTLDEMMQADLDARHTESGRISAALARTGDALPGFGIVAAVLGVIITMDAAGGDTAMIGKHVAAALVGTFLGVLFAYGLFQPLASATEVRAKAEGQYMGCIRAAMFAMARGDNPLQAVDFARRSVEPELRCSFAEMEAAIKGGRA